MNPAAKIEIVVQAAVRLANGAVFTGLLHGDALDKANAVYSGKSESYYRRLFARSRDGFVTNKGRFVGRRIAYKIAVQSRQLTPRLYSIAEKDVWGPNVEPDGKLGAMSFNYALRERERKKNERERTCR